MKLSDIKVGFKILGIIGVFGITCVSLSLWQNAVMDDAQKKYSAMIEKADPALLSAARMRQNLFSLQAASYGLIAQDCPSEACETFTQQMATSAERFQQRYETAVKLEPAYQDELQPLKARFDDIVATLKKDITPRAKANDAAASGLMAELDPTIEKLSDDISEAIDTKVKENEAKGAELRKAVAAKGQIGLIVSVLVTLLITGLASLLAFGDIARGLKRLTTQMLAVSDGRLDQVIDGQNRKDEMGVMAQTLAVFRDRLIEAETLRLEAARLKELQEAEQRNIILALADDFEKSVGGIVTLVSSAATEMQAASAQLSATAQEASAQSVAVSAAAEQAGANVNAVASSAEELGASVSEISRQVETSAEIARAAVGEATAAGQIVTELNETAASIGGVVDLIAGLASQTNLLALNATIESARAGEAGKGFAVVAAEVKALAAQTARATTEISSKVAQIQEATTRAASAMHNITGTIESISQSSVTIASAVDQQEAATQEIVRAVTQASQGTQEVTHNIGGVALAAEQTGEAAVQVQSSSGELAEQAQKLHQEMDRFLATVRAA